MDYFIKKIPENMEIESSTIVGNIVVSILKEKVKKVEGLCTELGANGLCLHFIYNSKMIGYINENGYCRIISSNVHRETYKNWVEDGMPVDSTPVLWKDKEYYISNTKCLKSDKGGLIFDFELGQYQECLDENIQRWEHSSIPIAY